MPRGESMKRTIVRLAAASLLTRFAKEAALAEMAPVARIGVLADNSLRIEPCKQPFTVLPHE